MRSEWAALLDAGDFPAARAAWEGSSDQSLEASWDLGEIEERWGDALFFAGEPGASIHFEAARIALAPPGARFLSSEDNDRRMEAYGRVSDKLQAIDPSGKPRPGHDGRPHPRSATPRRAAPLEPRLTTARQSQEVTPIRDTKFAGLFHDADHWAWYGLGDHWRDAGQSLTANHPEGARRAYTWSLYYFELYHQAWTAHLPASRWDSDGGPEILEVRDLAEALLADPAEPPLPAWVAALLSGDWQAALGGFGDSVPSVEFQPVLVVLAGACRAAGLEDAARRLVERD